MLFGKHLWSEIEDGSVTVAFRRWRRPSVRAGGTLQTPAGLLAIDSVERTEADAITQADARLAGYPSPEAVLGDLAQRADGELYRIAFRRLGDDPRVALRNDASLTEAVVAAISAELSRLDGAGRRGPWTRAVLDLIARHPAVRAPDLAAEMGRDTRSFKADVRKLKAIGLTESLEVGYRLSPRGQAYLGSLDR